MSNTAPTNGVDPNVRRPSGVQAAAARADELFRQVNGLPDPNAPKDAPPAAQELPAEEQITLTAEQPPKDAKPQDVKPPAPTQEQQPPQPSEPANWEHRYNSMKGRFDQSQLMVQQLSDQVTSLQRTLATVSAAPAQPTQPTGPTPAELRASSLLTPEERAEYGDDFLNVVSKVAREQNADLLAEVERLKGQLGQTANVIKGDARTRMFSSMDEQLPNWRELNTNPEFISWLRLPDAYSGAKRQELLNAALEQNNAPRVLAFFKGFLADEATVAPAATAQPAVTPKGKVPLEQFAAPGRAKSAAAGAPAEKPFITRAQITAFYADVSAGKYRGREQEKDRMEREIFSAQSEGRIS